MPTLIENLNLIDSIKTDIKSAIQDKGVDMTGASFQDYPVKIGEIETGGTFVTETLSVSVNNTYYPGEGVDGFSQVIVDVPQSVEGYDEKQITEGQVLITNLNNSASYVASQVFAGNRNIQTVYLPNCKVVSEYAFNGCINISEVSLPICETIKATAFNSTGIISLYLPNCTRISSYAFQYCSQLTNVNLPKVSYLDGQNMFYYCPMLVSVSLEKIPRVAFQMFYNCFSLQDLNIPNVEVIDSYAFFSCRALQEFSHSNVVNVGSGVFEYCSSLREVNLPRCVSLFYSAFAYCSNLTTVNLPNLSIVVSSLFGGLKTLVSVSVPRAVSVGGLVFESCYSMTEFNFPNCVSMSGATFNLLSNGNISLISLPCLISIGKWYGNPIFLNTSMSELNLATEVYGVLDYTSVISGTGTAQTTITGSIYVNGFEYSKYIIANGWSSISDKLVPVGDVNTPMLTYVDGVISGSTAAIMNNWSTYLGNNNTPSELNLPECRVVYESAFYLRYSLRSVSLPKCEFIGTNAFRSCGLRYVDLPECRYIGESAFYDCTGLTISIPKCQYIGSFAFGRCMSLNTLLLTESTVCYLFNSNAFTTTNITSIYVPKSLISVYKSATNWSYYSDKFMAIQSDYEFSDGLVYGWATSIDSGFTTELGIDKSDVLEVSMTKCTTVDSYTFVDCINMLSANFPVLETIGDRAFENCTALNEIYINQSYVATAGEDIFSGCTNLSGIYVPGSLIDEYASAPGWSQYSSLLSINLPELSFSNGLVYGKTSIISSGFLQTLGITANQVISVSLPFCKRVERSTFYEFHSLKDVYLPKCEYIDFGAFYGANYINGIDLPVCSYIGDYAFYWCNYSFSYLKLGYSGVCGLGGPGAFYTTGQLNSIYVPASLVDSYKVAQNWSTHAGKIVAIPE